MNKNIGFTRNLYLAWLDAAAAFRGETGDPVAIRARLEPLVGLKIADPTNRRRAIDLLINIWVKTEGLAPDLHREALAYAAAVGDRLWLHYGLTLLAYPFFREVTAAVGQLGRREEAVTPAMVKQRLIAERGQLGSLDKAVERVLFSLRDWGVLAAADRRHTYAPQRQALSASQVGLEAWLLACALQAHPAAEMPFADLLRLPELYPFRLTLNVEALRQHPGFAIQRQGDGWEMVRRLPGCARNLSRGGGRVDSV